MPLTTVRYTGAAEPYFETALTGRPQSWRRGQTAEVDSAIASTLIASGLFVRSGDDFDGLIDPSGPTFVPDAIDAVRVAAGAVRSSYYRAFLPGIQPLGSGNVIDYSNNAADGRITPTTALTDAECWAVRDGFSTVAASTNPPKVVSIPASKAQINGTTESIFFSMGIKLATPAGTTTVAGFNSGASKGWRIPIDSSGGVLLRLGDGTNQYSPGASPSLKVTAATPEWHTVGFLFDCVTKQVWEVVDGMIASGPNASGLTGDLTNSLDLWIGGNSGVNNASFAASFRGVHLIAIPGSLPSNVVDLIRKVHTDPYTALTTADLGG